MNMYQKDSLLSLLECFLAGYVLGYLIPLMRMNPRPFFAQLVVMSIIIFRWITTRPRKKAP